MIVITDSNIFISALITPKGAVATLMKRKDKIQFLTPSYVIEEVRIHLKKIAFFAGKDTRIIWFEFKKLLTGVELIDMKNIPRKYILKAEFILKDVDIDDAIFVALHLYKRHKIWTGDNALVKSLKEKGYDFCITTSELKQKLQGK